jgi:hypothetical protein
MRITDFDVAVVDGDTHITHWVEQARSLRIATKMLEPVRKYVREGSTVIDCGLVPVVASSQSNQTQRSSTASCTTRG